MSYLWTYSDTCPLFVRLVSLWSSCAHSRWYINGSGICFFSKFTQTIAYVRTKTIYRAIRRCLFSPLDRPVYFSDVIFADIFTSFAKVLGDIWLSICMLLPGASLLILPTQEGLSRWILPVTMSLPYLVRLRQCIAEHSSPLNTSRKHLYNAIKYASSFPVIFLSAAQRPNSAQLEDGVDSSVVMFRLWFVLFAFSFLGL